MVHSIVQVSVKTFVIAIFVFFFTSTIGVSSEKINIHGYGELHYSNTDKEETADTMDNHRLVLGWTYKYSNRIRLIAEIDYEHAAQEMELEFAFIDFLFTDIFNIRAGTILMPIGYLNEYHEPHRYYSVERPYVQKYVIPTTWQEGGAGIFGSYKKYFRYRMYLVNGLDASKFTEDSGIRNGRGKVNKAPANDLAVTGRIEYNGIKNLRLGLSGYQGNAGQKISGLGDAGVTIIETDIRYWIKGLELTGLFSQIAIGDTEKINDVTDRVIGRKIIGFYGEAAYHIGKLFMPGEEDIVLFARHERFNTQKEIDSAYQSDASNDRRVTTLGIAYYPVPKIAVKVDFESWESKDSERWKQLNIGLGYTY